MTLEYKVCVRCGVEGHRSSQCKAPNPANFTDVKAKGKAMDIEFTIDGTTYSVPLSVYDDNVEYIKLPNGRVFHIEGWQETFPPNPHLQEEVKMVMRYNAITAKKVS